jgi:hypothetical protein
VFLIYEKHFGILKYIFPFSVWKTSYFIKVTWAVFIKKENISVILCLDRWLLASSLQVCFAFVLALIYFSTKRAYKTYLIVRIPKFKKCISWLQLAPLYSFIMPLILITFNLLIQAWTCWISYDTSLLFPPMNFAVFFLIRIVGVESKYVHSARRPLNGLLYLPRVIMMMEQLVVWRLAGETEVLGESLPQRHFFHHKSHLTRPSLKPGPPPWEASD